MELQEIFAGAVTSIVVAIVAQVVRYAERNFTVWLSEWRKNKDHALLIMWAEMAVKSAEQIGLTGQLESLASDKLEYALSFILGMAQDAGIEISEAQARALIEAFVHDLNAELSSD